MMFFSSFHVNHCLNNTGRQTGKKISHYLTVNCGYKLFCYFYMEFIYLDYLCCHLMLTYLQFFKIRVRG